MKLPAIGIAALLLAVTGAEVGTPEMRTRAVPIRVPLTPPLDWDVKEDFAKKKQLGKTIKAPLKEFLGEGWGKYIACQCQDWGSGCAYTLSLQAPEKGTGDRVWWGYLFSAVPKTDDWYHDRDVTYSIAYAMDWRSASGNEGEEGDDGGDQQAVLDL